MPYCPLCEKRFDTKNGLKGHFRFKHRYELGQDRPAKETPMTRAIRGNIERRMSGDAVVKAIEEEKRSEEYSGISGGESEYVPKKSFEGLKKALRDEPQNRLKGFEGLKKALRRWE